MELVSVSSSPERDSAFDLLRGGAVLFIVGYYHIQEIWVWQMPGPLAGWLARIALALFCFLSSYLLAGRTTIVDWPSVGRFYGRRLLKIYPLYLLALSLFVVLGLCPRELFWPSAFLINTLLNWNLLTLWFVSMIFLFYLLTPLFLWRLSLRKTLGLTIAFLALLLFLRWEFHWIDPRLLPNFAAFAFGIGVYQSPSMRSWLLEARGSLKWLALAGLLVASIFVVETPPIDSNGTHITFVVLLFLGALPWLVVIARFLCRYLPKCWVEFLATASFVLYLFHRIIYRLGDQISSPMDPVFRQMFYLCILLPVALVFSYWLQRAWQRLTT